MVLFLKFWLLVSSITLVNILIIAELIKIRKERYAFKIKKHHYDYIDVSTRPEMVNQMLASKNQT